MLSTSTCLPEAENLIPTQVRRFPWGVLGMTSMCETSSLFKVDGYQGAWLVTLDRPCQQTGQPCLTRGLPKGMLEN